MGMLLPSAFIFAGMMSFISGFIFCLYWNYDIDLLIWIFVGVNVIHVMIVGATYLMDDT